MGKRINCICHYCKYCIYDKTRLYGKCKHPNLKTYMDIAPYHDTPNLKCPKIRKEGG